MADNPIESTETEPKKIAGEQTRFKKGKSGNPKGASKTSKQFKELRKMSKEEFVRIGNVIIKGNKKDLRALCRSSEATVLELMIGNVCDRVIKRGDMSGLDVLLNRLIGKVTDKLDLHTSSPVQVVLTLPDNGRSNV